MHVLPPLEAQLMHRHYVLEGVVVSSLYMCHRPVLERLYAQEGILGLPTLEQRLLELSLKESLSNGDLEEALIASSPHRRRSFALKNELDFLRALVSAFQGIWDRPFWRQSNHVVYEVTRRIYADNHLTVEVAYGDFPTYACSP